MTTNAMHTYCMHTTPSSSRGSSSHGAGSSGGGQGDSSPPPAAPGDTSSPATYQKGKRLWGRRSQAAKRRVDEQRLSSTFKSLEEVSVKISQERVSREGGRETKSPPELYL